MLAMVEKAPPHRLARTTSFEKRRESTSENVKDGGEEKGTYDYASYLGCHLNVCETEETDKEDDTGSERAGS